MLMYLVNPDWYNNTVNICLRLQMAIPVDILILKTSKIICQQHYC